jgi:hypothetical protein
MSHYLDMVEDPSIKDQLFDMFVDQLHDLAETFYEDRSPFATAKHGPVAQLDRATAF